MDSDKLEKGEPVSGEHDWDQIDFQSLLINYIYFNQNSNGGLDCINSFDPNDEDVRTRFGSDHIEELEKIKSQIIKDVLFNFQSSLMSCAFAARHALRILSDEEFDPECPLNKICGISREIYDAVMSNNFNKLIQIIEKEFGDIVDIHDDFRRFFPDLK